MRAQETNNKKDSNPTESNEDCNNKKAQRLMPHRGLKSLNQSKDP